MKKRKDRKPANLESIEIHIPLVANNYSGQLYAMQIYLEGEKKYIESPEKYTDLDDAVTHAIFQFMQTDPDMVCRACEFVLVEEFINDELRIN